MDTTATPWSVSYFPALATVEDRLAGKEARPAETVVEHVSGWKIRHTSGARLAEVYSPTGEVLDAVQVIPWEWVPPEGGSSRADGPDPTTDELADALAEWASANASALDLPGLGGSWTEDSPTLDPDGFHRWGQHDGPEGSAHRFRWVWGDGSPCEGEAGEWRTCTDCGQ